MARNGSGTFIRLYSWEQDAANNIKIRADRMDAEMDGMADALTGSIASDGQTPVTANLPMSGFKHTNVADASQRNQYATWGQAQDSTAQWGGTDTGAADAYEITTTPVTTAYAAGQTFRFKVGAGHTNTGACTLSVNGLNTRDIKTAQGDDPEAGDIPAGAVVEVVYNGTDFSLLSMRPPVQTNKLIPSGMIAPFGGTSAPTGWLACDGSAVSRTTYADLFDALGTTWGNGDGSTTFNLPDLRDEFLRGSSATRDVGDTASDSFRSHNHSASTGSAGSHSHSGSTGSAGNHSHDFTGSSGNYGDPFSSDNNESRDTFEKSGTLDGFDPLTTRNAGNHSHSLSINSNGSHSHSVTVNNEGGSETAPQHAVVLYMIKT